MPPKKNAPEVKGQTNLFSFFKKPTSSGVISREPSTNGNDSHVKQAPVVTNEKKDVVDEYKLTFHQESVSNSQTKDFEVTDSPAVKVRGNKKIRPMDADEEAEFDTQNTKATSRLQQAVSSSDDELLDSDDDFKASPADSDESVESDDDFIVDSDDDDGHKTKQSANKRKRLQKPKHNAERNRTPKDEKAKTSLPPTGMKSNSKASHNSATNGKVSTPANWNVPRCDVSSAATTVCSNLSVNLSLLSAQKSKLFTSPDVDATDDMQMEVTGNTTNVSISANKPTITLPEGVTGAGSHEHNKYHFIVNRKDKSGRKPDHPMYNPRTLLVPDQFMRDQTPAMAQWWQFKAENMDTVLFFKVGKFYELYHMDADVGYSELNLIYMKGSKAHSGFPEVNYGKCASALVSRGYRVARVEQTETPDMLKQRNSTSKKKDKVVAREMCSIMSKGTRTYCHLDDLTLLGDEQSGADDANGRSVLMSVTEKEQSATQSATHSATQTVEYGIAIVDTIIGQITLAQFEDDRLRTRLRTLATKYKPTELVILKGNLTQHTLEAIKLCAPRVVLEELQSFEFPTADAAMSMLVNSRYFKSNDDIAATNTTKNKMQHWPAVLQAVCNSFYLDHSSALVAQALGGCVWQLKRSLIDYEILSLGKVFAYVPSDELVVRDVITTTAPSAGAETNAHTSVRNNGDKNIVDLVASVAATDDAFNRRATTLFDHDTTDCMSNDYDTNMNTIGRKCMTLDEIALSNLEVLVNNHDGSERGSLWAFVNRAKTAFGKRLLKNWLCNPLYSVDDINQRRDAVEELLTICSDECTRSRELLKIVPDLERLLVRVHSNGMASKGDNHPDQRAIMFEPTTYSMRKIRDFSDILSGFETVLRIVNVFSNVQLQSSLLRRVFHSTTINAAAASVSSSVGSFPRHEIQQLLHHFRDIFDETQAKRDGFIKPRAGIDAEYDAVKASIQELQQQLEAHLRECKTLLQTKDLVYFGSNKDRYQIEVPNQLCNRVPKEWVSKSQKKTARRYRTETIENLLEKLVKAEEQLAVIQVDILRRIFAKFDENRVVWSKALNCVALFDVLQSLAVVSSMPEYCWPELLSTVDVVSASASGDDAAVLHIKNGRHPMLEYAIMQRGDGEYIPNDLTLGGDNTFSNWNTTNATSFVPKLLLLSGPNMGGKSTLLRQSCLIVILAQLGCKVPAEACQLTPVDRIFTRVGATDKILAGQSTFFVELAETAIILKAATKNSLCILDELGRGTATFDGTAIAHSVVQHLVETTKCRTLFATHYHSLVDDWAIDPRVSLGHMDCFVTNSDNSDATVRVDRDSANVELKLQEVTFLYKLSSGSSPRSYGINVAKLAGLPSEVVELALVQSHLFEKQLVQQAEPGTRCENNDIETSSTSASGSARQRISQQNQVVALFERMVSVAHSTMHPAELLFVASEMLKRYHA